MFREPGLELAEAYIVKTTEKNNRMENKITNNERDLFLEAIIVVILIILVLAILKLLNKVIMKLIDKRVEAIALTPSTSP